MSIVSWNVRGINSNVTDHHIREIIKTRNACILGLTETKLSTTSRIKVAPLWYNTNFEFVYSNASETHSGGLLLMWDCDEFEVTSKF